MKEITTIKRTLIYVLAVLGTFQTTAMEFRPFRPGIVLIGGIESAIAEIKHQIDMLESEAVGMPSLKEELLTIQKDLKRLKENLGIAPLEMQIKALEGKFDGFALKFFKTAQVNGVYYYNTLNEKIAGLFNDPEIKQRLEAIIRLKRDISELKSKNENEELMNSKLAIIARHRQEINEKSSSTVQEIKELGEQINLMTRGDQRGLDIIKNQITMIKQQLQIKNSSQEAQSQLKPLEKKIDEIEQKMNNLLDLSFTEDRLNLLEQNKNKIRQYELLLEYLRNPSAIAFITPSKILGKE